MQYVKRNAMLFVGSTKNGNYAGIGRNYSENVITER